MSYSPNWTGAPLATSSASPTASPSAISTISPSMFAFRCSMMPGTVGISMDYASSNCLKCVKLLLRTASYQTCQALITIPQASERDGSDLHAPASTPAMKTPDTKARPNVALLAAELGLEHGHASGLTRKKTTKKGGKEGRERRRAPPSTPPAKRICGHRPTPKKRVAPSPPPRRRPALPRWKRGSPPRRAAHP